MIYFREIMMHVAIYGLVATLAVIGIVLLCKVAAKYVERVGRGGRIRQILALAATVMLIVYAGTKPPNPQITWDTGLSNNGTFFNTNNWSQICFRWTKNSSIATTEPVYFAAKHRNYQELEWDEIGQSTAGLGSWNYTFPGGENATNYLYYVFTVGEVHTNGVWIGNILQKAAPGTCGPDKMIIMKSRLEVNGKEIAPFKEK